MVTALPAAVRLLCLSLSLSFPTLEAGWYVRPWGILQGWVKTECLDWNLNMGVICPGWPAVIPLP